MLNQGLDPQGLRYAAAGTQYQHAQQGFQALGEQQQGRKPLSKISSAHAADVQLSVSSNLLTSTGTSPAQYSNSMTSYRSLVISGHVSLGAFSSMHLKYKCCPYVLPISPCRWFTARVTRARRRWKVCTRL